MESEYIINHIIKITPRTTHTRADFSTFLRTYRDFEVLLLFNCMDPMTDFDNSKKEFEDQKNVEKKNKSNTKKTSEYLLNTILMGTAIGDDFINFLHGHKSYKVIIR